MSSEKEVASIVHSIRTAIEDYAEFQTDDVRDAVLKGLEVLDTDLNETGFQQSSKSDKAAVVIEEKMNEADEEHEKEETESD